MAASRRGVRPFALKNHVQRVRKKLDAQNRAQATASGIAWRIIPAK
jgi:DNA-binding CsgD family transcriptional regulator